jgi:hypothetical protein
MEAVFSFEKLVDSRDYTALYLRLCNSFSFPFRLYFFLPSFVFISMLISCYLNLAASNFRLRSAVPVPWYTRRSLQRAELRSSGGCISCNFKELQQIFLCSEVLNFLTSPLAIQPSESRYSQSTNLEVHQIIIAYFAPYVKQNTRYTRYRQLMLFTELKTELHDLSPRANYTD